MRLQHAEPTMQFYQIFQEIKFTMFISEGTWSLRLHSQPAINNSICPIASDKEHIAWEFVTASLSHPYNIREVSLELVFITSLYKWGSGPQRMEVSHPKWCHPDMFYLKLGILHKMRVLTDLSGKPNPH